MEWPKGVGRGGYSISTFHTTGARIFSSRVELRLPHAQAVFVNSPFPSQTPFKLKLYKFPSCMKSIKILNYVPKLVKNSYARCTQDMYVNFSWSRQNNNAILHRKINSPLSLTWFFEFCDERLPWLEICAENEFGSKDSSHFRFELKFDDNAILEDKLRIGFTLVYAWYI